MARPRALATPRISSIALPELVAGDPDAPLYDDRHDGERLSFAGRETGRLAQRTLAEVELADLHLEALDSQGSRFADVVGDDIDVVSWDSHDSTWRDVALTGGRIGSLDLSGAELSSVRLTGLRIGYLDLRDSAVQDVLVEHCVIGTLDLPSARLTRVAFTESRVDDLDLRMAECASVDIRGLDVSERFDFGGRAGRPPLEGVYASSAQLSALAPALARHAGLAIAP